MGGRSANTRRAERASYMWGHVCSSCSHCLLSSRSSKESSNFDLLTEREQHLITQLDIDYRNMYGARPEDDEDLYYFLGDRYEFCRTWSAVSRSIPTYRKNPAKYLHRATMTFLTSQEKLASLGWPITESAAAEMGTTPLPSLDTMRSDRMAGNSMHLTVAAQVLFVGACCFARRDRPPVM